MGSILWKIRWWMVGLLVGDAPVLMNFDICLALREDESFVYLPAGQAMVANNHIDMTGNYRKSVMIPMRDLKPKE